MSEFLGEAQVVIRPDTTKFRAELTAQLAIATRGLAIPIPVVGTPASLVALRTELLATTTSMGRNATAAQAVGAAHAKAAAGVRAHTVSQGQLEKGVLASSLSLLGVRGATLAASGSFLAGAAAVTLFAKSVGLAANLETELNVFRVTAGATADEMTRVAEAARALGKDVSLPAVSAGDAAQAMTELAKAGLDVEDAIAGARGVLQLATAAQIDNAAATELAASALNAFGLAGADATHVADLFAGASLAAQGSITDIGIALQQASAAARNAGLSFEDTIAFLALLAKNGVQGSDAGTLLRTTLSRLIAPTDRANKVLEGLNVAILDAQGSLRPEVFADLERALQGLGTERERQQASFRIFGESLRAQTIFAREGVQGLNEMRQETNQAGLAAEVAGARTEGFAGDVENLSNQLGTLGTTIGQAVLPPLSALVQTLAGGVGGINTFIDQMRDLREGIKGLDTPQPGGGFLAGLSGAVGDFTRDAVPGLRNVRGAIVDMGEDGTKSTQLLTAGLGGLRQEMLALRAHAVPAIEDISRAFQGLSPEQILGRQAGLEEREVLARIGGDTDTIIAALRTRQEELEKQIATTTVQRRPELRRQLENQLLATIEEIASIEQGLATEAKRRVDEAQQARDERQRAILATFDLRVARQQNRVIEASFTATLQDDLKSQQRLSRILRSIITSGKLGAADLAKFARDLITTTGEIKRINQEIKEARKAERRERLSRIQEELSLDVDIARATGNEGAQRRALQAEIKFFQERIRATRKGSLERKRWLLELRRAQAELRELKGEAAGTGRAFRELAFEFLQTQQGFAANLLGNLLPGSATAGTVGGGNGPGAAGTGGELAVGARGVGAGLGREAQISEARGAGVSRAQASSTNEILRQILRVLKDVHRGTGHPEARYTQVAAGAAMDVM
jgi:TP901 family phage tail tape measure protein